MSNPLNEILTDVAALLRKEAGPRGTEIRVAPEIAAWLGTSQPTEVTHRPEPQPVEEVPPVIREPLATEVVSRMVTPVSAEAESASNLEALADLVSQCHRCSLCETRTQTVFGSGNPKASLVFVGEAPGEDEDRQGLPFVGRAGQLLTTIIEHPRSMGLRREDVYICNVLKCRPPGNRNPEVEEMRSCEPFLVRQLQLIQPKVICALGGFAAKQLLKTDDAVGRLRGKWHFYHGIPVRVTYHPSYLLRLSGEKETQEKKKVWDDVMAVLRLLNGEETVRG